jgi:hypothetical protein
LPGRTATGKRLAEPPTIEIYRGAVKADGSADLKSFHMVYTIPGSLAANYIVEKHIEFVDPIAAEETRSHPGGKVAYLVRTRISAKKASPDSNIVQLAVYPVPEGITDLEARVTETAVELSWTAPTKTSGGEPLPQFGYRIYRGQLDSPGEASALEAATDAAAKDLRHVKWKSKPALLASPETNSYRDTDFEFNKTYVYVVRSAIANGAALESADSRPAIVTPKDIFPPAAPQGLVAAVLHSASEAAVDLSWSINSEPDVAGYRVYRSESEGVRGEPLSADLSPSPAYRDATAQSGRRYWYSVTAIDRAGNESVPSAQILVEIAQPSS